MSNTFYNYISEKIITYFKTNEPNPGDKFFVQFETEDQVDKLYKELKNNIIAKSFIYEDTIRKQKYEAIELVTEIIARLEGIPDGCAECFPFELIDEFKQEYLTDNS